MEHILAGRREQKRYIKEFEAGYIPVSCRGRAASPLRAKTKDISLGGLCLEAEKRFLKGSILKVGIHGNGSGRAEDVFCRVEWCRKKKGAYTAGMSFINLDKVATEQIYCLLVN